MRVLQLLVERPGENHPLHYWKLSGPKYRVLFEALRRLPFRAYLLQQGWVVNDEELALLQMVGFHIEEGHLSDEDLARADCVTRIFAFDWLPLWLPCSPALN
jgi:hypothetical protein